MKLTDKNINKFLKNPSKQFKIFDMGFTKKEEDTFQHFKLPKVDTNGLAYSHYGQLENMNDLINFLTILGDNSSEKINMLEHKIKEITKTVLDGYNKKNFWLNIRISYKDPEFNLERWHTDGKYFMNKNDNEFQSKIIMVFQGPGTLLLNNSKEDSKNYMENKNSRQILSDKFKKSKILQLNNTQGLIFISHPGTLFQHGLIHSEPKKDRLRMFMQIIPGSKEDIELLTIKHEKIYLLEKDMWQKYKIQKGGNTRKSPTNSATLYDEGTIELGKDKLRWVVKKTSNGIKRWVPFHSTNLFGYKPLTVDYLAKNIGKPIVVYERQLSYKWPKNSKDFDVKYTFTCSGDAEKKGKIYSNWLKKRNPLVKKNDIFIIDGKMKSNDIDSSIQIGPLPTELVSTNLINTDAFVKN